jgi:hypothetical protein
MVLLRQIRELLLSARLRPFEAIGLMGLGGTIWGMAVEGTAPPWAPGWIGWPIAILGIAMLLVGAFLLAVEIKARWPQGLYRETLHRTSAPAQSRTVVSHESDLPAHDDDAYRQGLRDGLRIALEQLSFQGATKVAPHLIARTVGDDVLEIRDEVTAKVTRVTFDSAGDVVSDPPSAAPLVGSVLRAFAGVATATGRALDATVRIEESSSDPAAPRSPDTSTHDQ